MTLRHEVIHVLREAGLITDKEWATLQRAVRGSEGLREAERLYPGEPKEVQVEEAIAQMFGEYRAGAPQLPRPRRIFARVRDLLTRLGNALRGMGFTSVDAIFARIESGAVGQREGEGRLSAEALARQTGPGTHTPEFRNWFGDSKVVDAEGKPLRVYHGTPQGDIEAFDEDRAGRNLDSGWLGRGFYFTDRTDVASYYARTGHERAPTVMPVYLSLKNPFYWGRKSAGVRGLVLRGESLPAEFHDAVVARAHFRFDAGAEPDPFAEEDLARAIRDVLMARGYDGVIADVKGGREYVAFRPEQIKSAFNRGTWSSADPRVRYAAADPMDKRVPIIAVEPRFADLPYNEARTAARSWAKEHLRGTYTNADQGWRIQVDGGGIGKATSGSRESVDLDVLKVMPRLLETSVLRHSRPPVQPEEGVRKYHYFLGAARLAGQVYGVRIVVKEQTNGMRFYDHHSFERMGSAVVSRELTAEAATPTPSPSEPTISVGELFGQDKPRTGGGDAKYSLFNLRKQAAPMMAQPAQDGGSEEVRAIIRENIGSSQVPLQQRVRDVIAAYTDRRMAAFKQAVFDRFHAVRQLGFEAGDMTPWQAMQLTKNLPRVMAELLRHGPLAVYRDPEIGRGCGGARAGRSPTSRTGCGGRRCRSAAPRRGLRGSDGSRRGPWRDPRHSISWGWRTWGRDGTRATASKIAGRVFAAASTCKRYACSAARPLRHDPTPMLARCSQLFALIREQVFRIRLIPLAPVPQNVVTGVGGWV